MKIIYLAFLCMLATISFRAGAQHTFKAQAGFGYLEHFSLGGTLELNERHNLSLLYGSNFFIKPKEFSSILLQYDLEFPRWRFASFTPLAGLKGGYAIFTNENYQWQVISVVPFLGIYYPLNSQMVVRLESGPVISFEQAAKRLNYNEIGYYKPLLPEIKITMLYTLFKNNP